MGTIRTPRPDAVPEILTALQDSALAEALRLGRWSYASLNAAHILAVALLVGGILPLDLRLLGLWPRIPLAMLARVSVPVAGTGLGLALITGPLLFITDPLHYLSLTLFQLKLGLIALGGVNILWVHTRRPWRQAMAGDAGTGTGSMGRGLLWLGGLFSIMFWLAALVCGRFIAYV